MPQDQPKDADIKPSHDILPLILCGQDDRFLWPRARRSCETLLARTDTQKSHLATLAQTFHDAGLAAPILVTSSTDSTPVQEQLAELGLGAGLIIETPAPAGTAISVCAGVEYLAQFDPEQLMLICLADHWTYDTDDLIHALRTATPLARHGHLVMFGVASSPIRPNLVHIEMAQGNAASTSPQPIAHMAFDPEAVAIDHMIGTNRYLCAADIMLCSVKTMRASYGKHAASIRAQVRRAIREGQRNDALFTPAVSLDQIGQEDFRRSILEHEQGYVVPCKFAQKSKSTWNDFLQDAPKDDSGSHISGRAVAINCAESLVINDNQQIEVVAVGLESIAVVATDDALLVTDLQSLHQVPSALQSLALKTTPLMTGIPTGQTDTIYSAPDASLKWINVPVGATLPERQLQGADTTWVVISGSGEVMIDAAVQIIAPKSVVSISQGQTYQLINTGQTDLRLIEIVPHPRSTNASDIDIALDDLALTRS